MSVLGFGAKTQSLDSYWMESCNNPVLTTLRSIRTRKSCLMLLYGGSWFFQPTSSSIEDPASDPRVSLCAPPHPISTCKFQLLTCPAHADSCLWLFCCMGILVVRGKLSRLFPPAGPRWSTERLPDLPGPPPPWRFGQSYTHPCTHPGASNCWFRYRNLTDLLRATPDSFSTQVRQPTLDQPLRDYICGRKIFDILVLY